MIISSFLEIDKASVARTIPNYVNLDFEVFKDNIDLYLDVLEYMNKNLYNVLIPASKELREKLLERKVEYIFVRPEESLKEDYVERYKQAEAEKILIDELLQSWEDSLEVLPGEKFYILEPGDYLIDAISRFDEAIYSKEDLKETFSSGFSAMAPENARAIMDLVDHKAINDLKKAPKPLPEEIHDVEDILIDDLCLD